MTTPVFTSKRSGKPPAPPRIVFPARPEEVQSGILKEMWIRYQQSQARARSLQKEIGQLRQQQAQYQATVNTATPQSDMVAVAAAEAGIKVLQRSIGLMEGSVPRAIEDERRAREAHEVVWSRLQALRRHVLEGFRVRGPDDLALSDRQVKTELRNLAGIIVEGG